MEKKIQIKDKSNFVWYSLRVSFWVMIGLWFISLVISKTYDSYPILGFIFICLVIFTFIISIIHLIKYKEKALAIVALVLSSIEVFVIIFYLGKLFSGV